MIGQMMLVAFGSALGGAARFAVGNIVATPAGRFPLATLVVNAIGGLLIGLLSGLLPIESERTRLLLMTGFCGGFTTFSAFSLESNGLVSAGETAILVGSILLNLLLAIGGCRLGFLIARA